MSKLNFTRKTVLNYIIGDDIDNFKLEELENDSSFMLEVINLSNDVRMYDNASESVKTDFTFIVTIIEKFKDNTNFIIKVVEYYFKSVNGLDIDKFELTFMLNALIKEKERRNKYARKAFDIYSYFYNELQDELEKDNDGEFGKGYILLYHLFINCPYAKEYLANMFINEIFYEDEKSIYAILKENYVDKNKSLKKFIIEYVEMFDSCLSAYLVTNTKLLNEICEDLEYRVNKLRIVEKELTIRKFDILWKEGYEEYKLREDYLSYCFLDFFDNVLSDNKLTNLYCDHINISEGYKMKFDYFDKNNLSFPDLAFYKHLDKKAKELFSTFDIFEEDDEIIKTQIFQFKKRS